MEKPSQSTNIATKLHLKCTTYDIVTRDSLTTDGRYQEKSVPENSQCVTNFRYRVPVVCCYRLLVQNESRDWSTAFVHASLVRSKVKQVSK